MSVKEMDSLFSIFSNLLLNNIIPQAIKLHHHVPAFQKINYKYMINRIL